MKVICISGKAGHGKDTIAELMKEHLIRQGKSVLVTHYADLVKYICKQFFGWNGLKDVNGRQLLQNVGTDVVRSQNPNYWVDFVIGILTMFSDKWEYVLIPDCRFPNEIEKMKQDGFNVITLRIVRSNYRSSLTNEQKNHPSETALDNYNFDYTIYNNDSLVTLDHQVVALLEQIDE